MINVTNGTTTGGSNILNFNPRDSIQVLSWTDDAGTHARIFGYHEKDVALVGVPADARRASFSSAAVVELLLKQAGMLSITRIKQEVSEFEKIVGVLMFIASREDTGEAVRMAACHGLQQIGATLAAR